MSNSIEDIVGVFGGVSQQDISLRLPHQVESSLNCYHSVALGTRLRNPTSLVKAGVGVSGESFIYSFNRGLTGSNIEKYSLVYNADGLNIIDLSNGNTQSVTGDISYLEPFSSSTGYEASTVKDTTFITNRNVVPVMKATISPTVDDIGYCWIRRTDPVDGYTYTINYNGTDYTSSGQLNTAAVATDLATKHANFTASGNIVKVITTTSLTISDSYGDQASSVFFNTVDSEADLPKSVNPNLEPITIEIVGKNSYASSYWLKYQDGGWTETVGEGVLTQIDETTMPYQITRVSTVDTGTYPLGYIYTIEPMTWEDRLVGDDDNSKVPSFIDSQIVDIFFFKNRLGLLTPNSILFSEVGEYYNFFRTTQVAVLDSDRIDVDIEAKKAIRLYYVSFLEDNIVIFGDGSQFRISHEGIFSINTISATLITEYDFNSNVRPLSIDSHVYFLGRNGEYNSLYVYSTEGVSEVSRANSVSGHIPKYIDRDIASMVGSSVDSILFFRSKADKGLIYVYKYLYDGDNLLQSAWSKWRFSGDIEEIFTTESELHLLIGRSSTITEDVSVTWNGVWNDDKIWTDDSAWNDSIGSLVSNLESIQLVPQNVYDTFLDNGTVSYGSRLGLSEYLPRSGDNVILSAKVNLRTIYVKADVDSSFKLRIDNIDRNKTRVITEKYVLGRKPFIMGKSKDVRISIEGTAGKGFRLDGYSMESNINQRSNQI